MRIYIAGPLSSDSSGARLKNCLSAINAGVEIMRKGHTPFVPHLMDWFDWHAKRSGIDFAWRQYIDWCLVWVAQCEALLYLGPSPGADIELAEAERLGLKVYQSVSEIEGCGQQCAHEPNFEAQVLAAAAGRQEAGTVVETVNKKSNQEE